MIRKTGKRSIFDTEKRVTKPYRTGKVQILNFLERDQEVYDSGENVGLGYKYISLGCVNGGDGVKCGGIIYETRCDETEKVRIYTIHVVGRENEEKMIITLS